jgi:pentatricopeptide repeat protein
VSCNTDTVRDAFALLPTLQERGVALDVQTINMLLSGCARLGDLVTALRLWERFFSPYALLR